jgi:hypothetical protein
VDGSEKDGTGNVEGAQFDAIATANADLGRNADWTV